MRETKQSGLPWVGNIPNNWEVVRGKNAVKKLKRPTLEDDGVITCFRDGEVTLRSKRREEGFTFSFQETGYQGIEPGDLVIHGMDGFAGAIGISDSRGKATPVLNVLDSKHNKRYLMYYFRTIAKCGYFESVATGIRVRTCDTNWNKISVTPIVLPPPSEQSGIAAFLDDRCSKIDEAIAKHKALIEKLDEYRKAVITKAVTKGVRGEREMKESGLDWLGSIPSTWTCSKVKHECELHGRIGWNGLRSNEFEENSYSYLVTGQDFNGPEINWKVCFQIRKERYDEDPFIQIHNGELLVTKDGTVGKVAIVSDLDKPACLNSGIFVVRQKHHSFVPKYLYWQLASPLLKSFNDYSNLGGTTIIHLYQKTFEQMPLIIPPKEEQSEIVAFLDKKCTAIDSAKERHQHLITKLEEYKKSLIYNAVTGKIEC